MKAWHKVILILLLGLFLSGCAVNATQLNLVDLLTNLQKSLQPIWQFLIALCYVLGLWFIGLAVFKLKQYGQMTVMMATHANLGPTIAYFVVGTGLLFIPTLLDTITMTVWNYGAGSIQGYQDTGGDYSDIMVPLTQVVQVIGLIAFMRGWIAFAKLGHQGGPPGTLSKGIMYMLGGIMAININGTIDVIKATFGLV